MQCLLAIDQSTSATKALLLSFEGEVLESASREHRQLYPQPGWVEHDAEEIWCNTLAVSSEVLLEARTRGRELSCVSIANQRETIVVFERGTGRPLHAAIVWQCRRGDSLCAQQSALAREQAIRDKSGLRVDSYFSASKLQWLVRERPDLATRLARGTALIGTIDTYLIYRLTAGSVFATDHTNACRTLLYDIRRLCWDDQLCDWWQVPREALAEVRASDACFGETTLDGQLARSVPIRGVMGDSHAAMFAQQCIAAGSAKVTFGTGSSVLMNAGGTPPTGLSAAVGTLAWVRGGEPTYALEGIITSSAATLTWLRDQLGILGDTTSSDELAEDLSSSGSGVYIIPAFSGLGAPWWREGARGAIVGLSAHSNRRHVVRAALESIAYQLRDVLEMMRKEAGVDLREIRADGGPTANAPLMQFVSDIVGLDLRVARRADRAARGAALMGGLGAGFPIAPSRFTGEMDDVVYRRTMAPDQVQARYAGWLRAVSQVLCVA
jgi:glycerol kinase